MTKSAFKNVPVLITSAQENGENIGAGFVVKRAARTSYVLTCAHVVQQCGGEVNVGGVAARVLQCGRQGQGWPDLAVLKVPSDLRGCPPLPLHIFGQSGTRCKIVGYYRRGNIRRGVLSGELADEQSLWLAVDPGFEVRGWDVRIDEDQPILQEGFSGAPVLDDQGRVLGIMTHRFTEQGRVGQAIAIEALRDVWTETLFYVPYCPGQGQDSAPTVAEPLAGEALRANDDFQQLVRLIRKGKATLIVGSDLAAQTASPLDDALVDLKALAKTKEIPLPPQIGLTGAAAILKRELGGEAVADAMRVEPESRDLPQDAATAYRLLAKIPDLYREILTTNWDSLLEAALPEPKVACDASQLGQRSPYESCICKLRGFLEEPETLVLTDVDHLRLLEAFQAGSVHGLWEHAATLMVQHAFVFLGYRPQTVDFCLLQNLIARQVRRGVEPDLFFVDPAVPPAGLALRHVPATAADFLLAVFKELEEFANRKDELSMVFDRRDMPYMEFHGHFNGKSALLDRVEAMADGRGWEPEHILRVDWDRGHDRARRDACVKDQAEMLAVLQTCWKPPGRLRTFEDVAEFLRSKEKVFVIFDATEYVCDSQLLIELLVKGIAPAIQEQNEAGQLSKLLLSGRYPLPQGLLPYAFRLDLFSHSLLPFNIAVVREMAERFLLATDPASQATFSRALIQDILDVSSGYAAFIRDILVDLTAPQMQVGGEVRSLPAALSPERWHKYVLRFNDEVDNYIKWQKYDQLRETYEESLCVFRFLNSEIIDSFSVEITEPESEDPVDPLLALTEIYVLSPLEFEADHVVRRTKMLYLQDRDPEAYERLLLRAQDLLFEGVLTLYDSLQREYLIEWLFVTLHLFLARHEEDEHDCYDFLATELGKVTYHVDPQRTRGRGGIGAQIVADITKDGELSRLFYRCLGERRSEILRLLEHLSRS